MNPIQGKKCFICCSSRQRDFEEGKENGILGSFCSTVLSLGRDTAKVEEGFDVCAKCKGLMSSVLGTMSRVEDVEGRVREFQLAILEEMKELKILSELAVLQLKKIKQCVEGTVADDDFSGVEEQGKGEEKEENCKVVRIRETVLNVTQQMQNYQENILQKFFFQPVQFRQQYGIQTELVSQQLAKKQEDVITEKENSQPVSQTINEMPSAPTPTAVLPLKINVEEVPVPTPIVKQNQKTEPNANLADVTAATVKTVRLKKLGPKSRIFRAAAKAKVAQDNEQTPQVVVASSSPQKEAPPEAVNQNGKTDPTSQRAPSETKQAKEADSTRRSLRKSASKTSVSEDAASDGSSKPKKAKPSVVSEYEDPDFEVINPKGKRQGKARCSSCNLIFYNMQGYNLHKMEIHSK